jgi:hypothetical protein
MTEAATRSCRPTRSEGSTSGAFWSHFWLSELVPKLESPGSCQRAAPPAKVPHWSHIGPTLVPPWCHLGATPWSHLGATLVPPWCHLVPPWCQRATRAEPVQGTDTGSTTGIWRATDAARISLAVKSKGFPPIPKTYSTSKVNSFGPLSLTVAVNPEVAPDENLGCTICLVVEGGGVPRSMRYFCASS